MGRLKRHLGTAAAIAVLVESARSARTHEVAPEEEQLFRAFNDAPDALHPPIWAVMQSGSLAAVFVVAADLHRRGRARAALTTAIAGTAVWGGVKLIKPRVGRGRPDAHVKDVSVRGKPQTGCGYPSGHAAVAMTIAKTAFDGASPTARTAAHAVAAVTGGARMYVGAHLPLDVAGGWAIGLLAGRAVEVIRRYRG